MEGKTTKEIGEYLVCNYIEPTRIRLGIEEERLDKLFPREEYLAGIIVAMEKGEYTLERFDKYWSIKEKEYKKNPDSMGLLDGFEYFSKAASKKEKMNTVTLEYFVKNILNA